LGNHARRDPGVAMRTYHGVPKRIPKTGTFYLAGNRNFLLGSDILRLLMLQSRAVQEGRKGERKSGPRCDPVVRFSAGAPATTGAGLLAAFDVPNELRNASRPSIRNPLFPESAEVRTIVIPRRAAYLRMASPWFSDGVLLVLGGHPGVLRGADGWCGVFGAVPFRVVVHSKATHRGTQVDSLALRPDD